MNWLFAISALGCLWACKKRSSFFNNDSGTRFLARLFCEMAELFFQVSVLFIFFRYGLASITPSGEMSLAPFFMIMGAYLFKLLRGTTDFFVWQVLALTFLYAEMIDKTSLIAFFGNLAVSIFLIGLICTILLGMEKRLLLSNLPMGTKGLPLLMMNMVILLLALWGFQGILF